MALILLVLVVLLSARTVAGFAIDYHWWKEMGQLPTWAGILTYRVTPLVGASLIAAAVLLLAHARGLRFAGVRRVGAPLYYKIVTVILLVAAVFVATATVDTWTVVRFFGGRGVSGEAAGWQDPVFGQPLAFYLFDLPFLNFLRSFLLALTIVAAVVYWITARGWQLREQLPLLRETQEVDPRLFRLEGGLESRFLRGAAVIFLLALAARYYLGRFELLFSDHGFLVGVDYVNQNVTLPLQWLVILSCAVSAVFVWLGRWLWAASLVVVMILHSVVPRIVEAVHVRPNEISLQRPYIDTHIKATRAAYGLDRRAREVEFSARIEAPIDPARHEALFDNVRLWDWRAFHDTTTQIQALRTYYVFNDSDVDRYAIDGKLRQVMLSPRELDIRQLPDAQASWVNSHVIYTHGYGMVMAEANRITAEGLPVLFVQDAPPTVKTESLKLTRPEIYFGETTHEPVFVATSQQEFSYPAGERNIYARYEGRGGIPISLPVRLAAALSYSDINVLLTTYFTADSRLMIRRSIPRRLRELAGFIAWDSDPYLVLTDDGGRLYDLQRAPLFAAGQRRRHREGQLHP